jgi:hypothetical protein
MRLIRKKEIKFIKLCLISPWLEQIVNLLYLISLPIIIFKFQATPTTLTTSDIDQYTRNLFNEDELRTITNKTHLQSYIGNLMEELYAPKRVPFYVPVGSARLRRFSTISNCTLCLPDIYKSDKDYCKFNTNNVTFSMLSDCAEGWNPSKSNSTGAYYKSNTGNVQFYELFVFPLNGYYGTYDINGDGEWIDLMGETTNSTLSDFISDKNNKCKSII